MKRFPAIAAMVILAAGARGYGQEDVRLQGAENKVTVSRGPLSLVFDQEGRGFIKSAKRGDVEVCTASQVSGLFASLIRSEGVPAPLGPLRGNQIVGEPRVVRVTGKKVEGGGQVEIVGTVKFEGIGEGPFNVKIVVPDRGPAMIVSAEMTVPQQARGDCLASFGLALPLQLMFHPTSETNSKVDRKTAAAAILPRAGTDIPEIRTMVARQDLASVWGPMLWTLAGIRQATPCSCEVWEAWSTQNPPFILQHHNVHPGWMAVADARLAVAAGMGGIEKIAPKEIYLDSQAKVLRICFQSPYSRPLDPGSSGRWLDVERGARVPDEIPAVIRGVVPRKRACPDRDTLP